MRKLKKSPRKQLEKYSTIFTQLGLVLVLFIVFVVLEYKTEKPIDTSEIINDDNSNVFMIPDHKVVIYKKDAPKPKPEPKVEKQIIKDLSIIEKTDEDDFIEKTIETKDVTNNNVDIVDPDDIVEVVLPEELDPEPVSILNVQKAPVFEGCEGLSEQENRKCLDRKMKKLIQRYFDSNLANELGLKSGKHRITTQFVIDTKGYVTDVKIMAPHPRLKRETNRIIKKIPQFTPGMQQDKNVKVKYTLPILFRVD